MSTLGAQKAARVTALRRYITDEIFIALGSSSDGWGRKLSWPIFWLPAHRFASLAAEVDAEIQEIGINEAAKRLLAGFVRSVDICGAENVPSQGPLLVASNHPGAYDSVAILSSLNRRDVKVIASGIPFLQGLPNLARHLVYVPDDAYGRMNALRAGIRHLEDGGALLIFPSGIVDPDPDIFPQAYQELSNWSQSVEIMLRRVPQTLLLLTIASGVLSPSWFRNPSTRLTQPGWTQRKLAEFLQVMQQLIFPHSVHLTPRISYGKPLTFDELQADNDSSDLMQVVVERARLLLSTHTASVGCSPEG
jgi:hypothetical protein